MKKVFYTAPELELVEMEVEQGFAASPEVQTLEDLDYGSHNEME